MGNTKKINSKAIIAVLAITAFLASFNQTMINIALSKIMDSFGISSGTAQWIITGYLIVASVMVPITAFLIQSINTRRLFLGSMIILLIGTILCAVSNSFVMLIISRMIQAVGAGMVIPIMTNVVLIISPKDKVGTIMGLCVFSITMGPALGFLVAGEMLEYFSWNMLFIILIPIMALMIGIGYVTLKNVSKLTYPKLDYISVVLSTIGLALFVYGINIISSGDIKTLLATLVPGTIIITLFILRQRKLKEPMLNLSPFRFPDFVMGVIVIMISLMTVFTMNVMLPMLMEGSLGVSSFDAAVTLLPAVLCNALVNTAAGKIYDKIGIKILAPCGLTIAAVFMFILSTVTSNSSLQFIVIVYGILYMGIGLVEAPIQTYTLSNLSEEYYPHGVAIINTLQQVGAALESALLIGIMSSVQQKSLMSGNVSNQEAISLGFSKAAIVGGVIIIVGIIISLILVNRKRNEEVLVNTRETIEEV